MMHGARTIHVQPYLRNHVARAVEVCIHDRALDPEAAVDVRILPRLLDDRRGLSWEEYCQVIHEGLIAHAHVHVRRVGVPAVVRGLGPFQPLPPGKETHHQTADH